MIQNPVIMCLLLYLFLPIFVHLIQFLKLPTSIGLIYWIGSLSDPVGVSKNLFIFNLFFYFIPFIDGSEILENIIKADKYQPIAMLLRL